MDIDHILALFPGAKVQSQRDQKDFSLPYNGQWLVIPDISKRESALLTALLKKDAMQHHQESPWEQYLRSNGKKPEFEGQIRFLFFKCDDDASDQELWLNAIQNMFSSPLLDIFSLEKNEYCFVEKITPTSYGIQDFLGVLQTVEADTGVKFKLYVGHSWSNTDPLVHYFNEELHIFQRENGQTPTPIMYFSSLALPFFTKENLRKSNILAYYRKKIYQDTQLPDIIRALYKHQGNISSAAKQLYLHRNTLLYHLDKINQSLGLDLKQMDDLILAYLAIL